MSEASTANPLPLYPLQYESLVRAALLERPAITGANRFQIVPRSRDCLLPRANSAPLNAPLLPQTLATVLAYCAAGAPPQLQGNTDIGALFDRRRHFEQQHQ